MHLLTAPAIRYADPWNIPWDRRRAALGSGSPRIAYYYTQPDTSTFRYRVFNMIEALAATHPDVSATWITEADGQRAVEIVSDIDTLVIARALYAPHVAAVIARAKALGKRVLFDVDDLIFDPRFTHLIMETLDQRVDEEGLTHWFGRIGRLSETLRHCEGAITTNEYLAEHIRDVHDVSTSVIPNFLNAAQLDLSAALLDEKRTQRARDGWIDIGYFSGTPTHNRDFALIEPAIVALLEEHPRVRLRIVGFLDLGGRIARYRDRVKFVSLQDFLNLQRSVAEVEVNVVPLQDNEFTNCKSELKYFEAAVVGTVTVASPTYTLSRAISDGETGFLARSYEWTDALAGVIARVDELDAVTDAAAADALRRYSPSAQGAALETALL